MRRRGRRIGHWSLFGVTTPSGGSQRTCRVGFRRATARYAVQHREVLAVISRALSSPRPHGALSFAYTRFSISFSRSSFRYPSRRASWTSS